MTELEELVYLTIGSASMCWSVTPHGVFDDQAAARLGKNLMEAINHHIKAAASLSHTTIIRDSEGHEIARTKAL